jgi:hypothetical protein
MLDVAAPSAADTEHTVVRRPPPEPIAAPPAMELVDGLISGRPQGLGRPDAKSEARPSDPDHDGHTEIRRPSSASVASAPVAAVQGPTVHACTCPTGHLNPVTQVRCRQCDEEIVDRASVTVPRPRIGVLRFSNNETVDLDGPVAIGRMPPDEPIDGVRPRVVAIDNSELSRFHALIEVDDWLVYVLDQGSTNETSVIAPGRAPITCRAHDRVLVPLGAVVNFGGVITCRFDTA